MRSAEPEPTDRQTPAQGSKMEILVGYILLIGVVCSAALIGIGWIWNWRMTGQTSLAYTITGMSLLGFFRSDLQQMLTGSLAPRILINLGIVVLLLTPYVRVLASVVYFGVAERNWKYVVITTFVLVVLTYSLFLRPAGG